MNCRREVGPGVYCNRRVLVYAVFGAAAGTSLRGSADLSLAIDQLTVILKTSFRMPAKRPISASFPAQLD